MKHPARTMPFGELFEGLQRAKASRLVSEQVSDDGLRLYCYSQSCVYERAWDEFTTLARGVILDPTAQRVVATPFPKFFNVGEGTATIPAVAFDTFEKLDGSLIILFNHAGVWRTATKGSFRSDQARAAARWIEPLDLAFLDPESTYLAEWVAPDNRIVVPYHKPELVLLAAFGGDGLEHPYDHLHATGASRGWRVARRYHFESVVDLIAHATTLPPTEEGYVLRFADGLRLKVKGDEYHRIHALISRCTPLAMWESMQAGDDLAAVRQQLPEEFWVDFDAITSALQSNIDDLVKRVVAVAAPLDGLPDKDVGLRLAEFPEPERSFIFPYRKGEGDLLSGRARRALFRAVRPTANRLDGYTPSYAMNRVMEESL